MKFAFHFHLQGAYCMRTKERGLSKRQAEILEYIIRQINLKGYPPSVREIGEAVGLQSSSTVHNHLTQLEEKGYIRRDPTKPRAIMILKTNDEMDAFYEEEKPFDEMINVPIIGIVAAGTPILASQNVEDTITFPMHLIRNNNSFMLRVKGDSMINAGIFDGDLLIVTPQKVANNGDIVVAVIGEEATVKTFYREKGRIRLQPENDAMDPIYVTEVELAGKVTGLFRTLH